MESKPVFDTLDPELIDRVISRRDALRKAGKVGVGLAVLSVPVSFGKLAHSAFGQSLPQEIIDVLNFALTLEYLERDFYQTAVGTGGLIPADTMAVFQQIAQDEAAHVTTLKGVLGGNAVPEPTFDFTAAGMFDPFGDYNQFLALSQGFEDTGVRAYKGQAPKLMPNDQLLTAALQIHSVEGRHASEVRRIRGQKGWIVEDNTDVGPLAPVYAGEAQTTELGVDVPSVTTVSATKVTEAFDEPLTKDEVLAIAGLFIKS